MTSLKGYSLVQRILSLQFKGVYYCYVYIYEFHNYVIEDIIAVLGVVDDYNNYEIVAPTTKVPTEVFPLESRNNSRNGMTIRFLKIPYSKKNCEHCLYVKP